MRIIRKTSIFVAVATFLVSSSLFANTAFAAPSEHKTGPGWGDGDKKNARVVSQADNKKSGMKHGDNDKKKHANNHQSDKKKPGWGWGDKNHDHTGPPGHSVRPGKSVKVNNHVNLGTTVNVIAQAGAHVVVNIVNNITQIFHISA